jgi:hypothetical protein
MDIQTLRDRIERLDPSVHPALRKALAAEYKRRTGEDCLGISPPEDGRDPFEGAYREAAHDLGERYIRGTSDYIRDHVPDLYRQTEEVDRQINEAWIAGRRGGVGIEQFRKLLREWHRLHLKQIEIYAEAEAQDKNDK